MVISKLMSKKSITLALSLFLFYPIGSAFAEESYEDLAKLSLEELLETEVVTTSKKSESLSETPGIVTVVTSKEIEQFGANNLIEVLERVPSIFMLGSYLNPQSLISIRGDLSVQYNVHTLILINGRPTRETFFGGLDSSLLLGFPLETIEKIEVIRGPGSVLYGSNAYSGVINIITKKPQKNGANINVGYGSFNTNKLSGTASYSDEDMNFITSLKFLKNDGWDFKAKDEQNNQV